MGRRITSASDLPDWSKDEATGLEHAQWRNMESTAGRWTTPDPSRSSMRIGNPQSFNRYSYVNNDPINHTDRSGRDLDPSYNDAGDSSDYAAEQSADQGGGGGNLWVTDGGTYYSVPLDQYDSLLNQVDENGYPIYAPAIVGTNIGTLSNVTGPSDFVDANRYLEGYAVTLGANGNFELADQSLYSGAIQEIANQTGFIGGATADFAVISVLLALDPAIGTLATGELATSTSAATDITNPVSVFHGSINDATNISTNGLDISRGTAFVSRDINAASNAISPLRYDVSQGLAGDLGIIESRIPGSDFQQFFAPFERPYSGFGGGINSTEIPLRTPGQIELFNKHMVGRPR